MIVTVSPSPLKAKQQARRRQAMPCLRNRPKDSSPQKRRERTGNFLRGSGTNKRQRKWGVSWGMGGEGRYGLCGLVRGVSLPKRGLAGILVTSVVLSSPSSPPQPPLLLREGRTPVSQKFGKPNKAAEQKGGSGLVGGGKGGLHLVWQKEGGKCIQDAQKRLVPCTLNIVCRENANVSHLHQVHHLHQVGQGPDAAQRRDGLPVALVEGAPRQHRHRLLHVDGERHLASSSSDVDRVAGAEVDQVDAGHHRGDLLRVLRVLLRGDI